MVPAPRWRESTSALQPGLAPTSRIGSSTTAVDGTYVIDRLDIGTYDVRFDDPTGLHRDEYFDNDPTNASTPVVVDPPAS